MQSNRNIDTSRKGIFTAATGMPGLGREQRCWHPKPGWSSPLGRQTYMCDITTSLDSRLTKGSMALGWDMSGFIEDSSSKAPDVQARQWMQNVGLDRIIRTGGSMAESHVGEYAWIQSVRSWRYAYEYGCLYCSRPCPYNLFATHRLGRWGTVLAD